MFEKNFLQTEQDKPQPYEKRGIDSMLAKMLTGTITDALRGDYWAREDVAGRVGHGIFSFGTLCQYFDLDEVKVKAKLEKLTLKKWRKLKRSFGTRLLKARAY